MILYGALKNVRYPGTHSEEQCKKHGVGAMGAHSLSNFHIVPSGKKTVTSDYYIRNILKNELKLTIQRRTYVSNINEVKIVPQPQKLFFVQDGASPHSSVRTQTCLAGNVPNFIQRNEWPGNSPDLNPIENLRSILDSDIYKEPVPKTMESLRRRLKYAWRRVPADHLQTLIHSVPMRLKLLSNVKEAYLVTNIKIYSSLIQLINYTQLINVFELS